MMSYNIFDLWGITMNFKTMEMFLQWIKQYEKYRLDCGIQGKCYKIGNKVFKIFTQFFDEEDDEMIIYSRDDILQFSSIGNGTYIFPSDTIVVGDIVVGYITDYVDATSLYKMSPLNISLDVFEKKLEKAMTDIRVISDCGVRSFDVTYNILYGACGFKVVDTMEYSRTNINNIELYKINRDNFINEIRLFLIDGYFDEFIERDDYLYSICYGLDGNFIQFLKEFRMKLSEYEGSQILNLGCAKKSLNNSKKRSSKYIREI